VTRPGVRPPALVVAGCLAVPLLTMPLAARAQAPARPVHVGLLVPGSSPSREGEAFLRGMRDLGYVEGQNLVVEHRSADGKNDRLPQLLAELERLKVDVIVTGGTAAALAAKQAKIRIPVVIGAMGDPVASGVVSSLARPGGNITGLSLAFGEGFAGKWIELLREVVPTASQVAVLWAPPGALLPDLEKAALTLGIQLQLVEVREPDQLARAFATMAAQHAAAMIVLPNPFTYAHRVRIVGLAARHRLPSVYGFREFADDGGLMAYSASLRDLWRRAATYVDRIVKGARPGDLPIEQPTTFQLIVNLKTARTLGLAIPQSVVLRADELID